MRWLLLIAALGVEQGGGTDYFPGTINVATHEVHYVIGAGSPALGPTAPSWVVNGSAGGLGFDADAETVYLNFEMPDCWDGTTDPKLKVYWFPETGDAIANAETVKWDFDWRSVDWGTEDTDNGTAESDTVTYTEAASPGDENDTHEESMTMVAGSGDQTIAAGDVLIGAFTRDVTGDSYSGSANIQHWEITVQQTKLKCDHVN